MSHAHGALVGFSYSLNVVAMSRAEAWLVYVIFMSRLHETPLSSAVLAGVVASMATALLLCTAMFGVSVRRGIQLLGSIEP